MSQLVFNTAFFGNTGFRSWLHLRPRGAESGATLTDNGAAKVTELRKEPAPAVVAQDECVSSGGRLSAEDYEAWLNHLRTRKLSQMRRGSSLAEEYERWMAQRARRRA